MHKCIEALILSSLEYREYDVILSVLTKEHGIVKVLAKGIKKLKNKNASACLPFSYVRMFLQWNEQKDMHILQKSEIIKSFHYIREDLRAQSLASFVCECIEKSGKDLCEINDVLDLFIHLKEREYYLLLCIFMVNMMRIQGIELYVDGCVDCRKQQKICAVSIRKGGFICNQCCNQQFDKILHKEDLKSIRYICKADISHYEILRTNTAVSLDVFELLYKFFEEYSGIVIKSYQFLKEILYLYQ